MRVGADVLVEPNIMPRVFCRIHAAVQTVKPYSTVSKNLMIGSTMARGSRFAVSPYSHLQFIPLTRGLGHRVSAAPGRYPPRPPRQPAHPSGHGSSPR